MRPRKRGERDSARGQRYGSFNEDYIEIEKAIERLIGNVQECATPLSVSTRGIGFSAVQEYNSMRAMWLPDAIADICTIHQYYRVTLYLAFYKIHEARCAQRMFESCPTVSSSFWFSEDYRQILAGVTRVPIATANVLAAIGRIDATFTWHSVLVDPVRQSPEECAVFLNPSNIREILDIVGSDATSRDFRRSFRQLCSIPGARWDDLDILQNTDDIWPRAYDASAFQRDVYAFQNIIMRASLRFPKRLLGSISPGGVAGKAGLVSMDPPQMHLRSRFSEMTEERRSTRKTRGPDGTESTHEVVAPAGYQYLGDTIVGATLLKVWAPDDISSVEFAAGTAAMAGECQGAQAAARLEISGKRFAHANPTTVINGIIYARQR